jgi:UPF0755 protein
MSLWSILATLTAGKSELPLLKVPEGYTAYQIAQELEKIKVATASDFLLAVSDKGSLEYLQIKGPSAEGFLFPETYRVPVGAGASAIVDLMVHQFYQEVGENFEDQCNKQGLTPYQAVILASIVEKEAKLSDERPIIAGVLYNRLHQKMRLQVNATVNYLLNSKNPWFTTEELGTKTPYNTYLHRGLPPTPICNPGLESLEAVLEPAQVPYLYYVARGDGSHLFATTFSEHQKNIRLVKRLLREKKQESAETFQP